MFLRMCTVQQTQRVNLRIVCGVGGAGDWGFDALCGAYAYEHVLSLHLSQSVWPTILKLTVWVSGTNLSNLERKRTPV
jgi:hypothetical protein